MSVLSEDTEGLVGRHGMTGITLGGTNGQPKNLVCNAALGFTPYILPDRSLLIYCIAILESGGLVHDQEEI